MICGFAYLTTSTPELLLGPVDADYTVTVKTMGTGVGLGADSSISWALGNPIYAMGATETIQLELRSGDSLYAVWPGSNAEVTWFAQPK